VADSLRSRLDGLFREARVDARIHLLQPGVNLAEAARDAADSGSTAVVAAGGDGTVSTVATALVGTSMPLGVLPLGTLNHFARDLKIPAGLPEAIAVIRAGRVTAVDVGRVNDRPFLNNASLGFYPNIVELRDELRRKGRRKLPAFVSATASVLWTYRGVVAVLQSERPRWAGRTPFVFVGNNEYTMEGLSLGGRPTLTGGQIVAYVAPRMRSRQLPLLLARALLGRVRRSGSFEIFPASQLEIAIPGASRVRIALDGEVTTMTTPLRFRSEPRALNVLCPGG
jgi:diacylglycerol kinase family enzyme